MKRTGLVAMVAFAVVLSAVPFFYKTATGHIGPVDYRLGVSVGQWVKYGNFEATGHGSEGINATAWTRIEVIEASGKNATLRQSTMYKNGILLQDETIRVNVETGWRNGTTLGGFEYLTTANLEQGDTLPTGSPDFVVHINRTEIRRYLGTARIVNIVEHVPSAEGAGSWTIVWDQASGITLEYSAQNGSINPPYKLSYSLIDTNIFATNQNGRVTNVLPYVIITAVMIATVIVGFVMLIRGTAKPTPTQETTPKTPSNT